MLFEVGTFKYRYKKTKAVPRAEDNKYGTKLTRVNSISSLNPRNKNNVTDIVIHMRSKYFILRAVMSILTILIVVALY